MKRTSLRGAACPVARTLEEIGDWWTLLIVRDAFNGARRFSEFEKGLGLAKNILAQRLRLLIANGIMELRSAPDGSVRNEYHLTEKGRRLRLVLVALRQWGEDNLFTVGEEMAVAVEKTTGRPIGRLQLTAQDGRALEPDDIVTVQPGSEVGPSRRFLHVRTDPTGRRSNLG